MAPLTMYDEGNTGTNLPAEIKISAVDGDAYKFLFMAKGGGSANKSYLFQETKALLNEATLLPWIFEKMQTLGTAACPPYHLAVVIGGTSAEFAVETAKLASTRYLDTLPDRRARPPATAFRDVELEAQGARSSPQQTGIGAQFGGKYFCHDVRIIRLPRHGASCPVAMAVSCSADRQALGQDHRATACSSSSSRPTRRASCPRSPTTTSTTTPVVHIDLNRPMAEIRAELSQVPGEDAGDADRPDGRRPRHRPRQDQGAPRRRRGDAAVPAGPLRVLRRPGQDAGGLRLRLVRADDGRADGQLRRRVPGRRRQHGDARQGQPLAGRSPTRARRTAASTSARSAARRPGWRSTASSKVEVLEYPELGMEAVWKIEVVDFPAFIVVDDKGNDFFEQVRREAKRRRRSPSASALQPAGIGARRPSTRRPQQAASAACGRRAASDVTPRKRWVSDRGGRRAASDVGHARRPGPAVDALVHRACPPATAATHDVVVAEEELADLGVGRRPVDERARRPVGGHAAVDEEVDDEPVEAAPPIGNAVCPMPSHVIATASPSAAANSAAWRPGVAGS